MLLSKETSLFDKDAVKDDIQAAGQKATSYITEITNDGIFVHQTDTEKDGDIPTDPTAYGVHISDDIDIVQGGEVVASYGTLATIGKENEMHSVLSNDGFSIIDSDKTTLLSIGQSEGQHYGITKETLNVTATFDKPVTFSLNNLPVTNRPISLMMSKGLSHYVYFTAGTPSTVEESGYYSLDYDGAKTFILSVLSATDTYGIIFATYTTSAVNGGQITLGSRLNLPISSSDPTPRADGYNTAAFGTGLQVYGENQVVVGQYNAPVVGIPGFVLERRFIVGNGSIDTDTGEISPSNAFSVADNGDIFASGDVYVKGHDYPIGTLLTESVADITVSSGASWHYIGETDYGCELELFKGIWLITYSLMCPTLANGKRLGGALKNKANSDIWYGSRSVMHASSTASGSVTGAFPVNVTGDSIIVRLMGFHTQGESQLLTGYIRAVKIT